MKKWLLVTIISFVIVAPLQAADRIAIVNMNVLFQELAQKTGVSAALEKEFKNRASELRYMEGDLESKIQRLQRDGSIMDLDERNKLEKDVMSQRETFSQKAYSFEQDHQRRSNEERSKLIKRIKDTIKKIAADDGIYLVIDTSIVAFNGNNIKDITDNVLKQVQ